VLKYLPRIHEPLSQEECCYKLRKVAHTHHHCLVFFLLQKEAVYGHLQDMEDFKSLRYKVFCLNCECLHFCNFTFYFKRTITKKQKNGKPYLTSLFLSKLFNPNGNKYNICASWSRRDNAFVLPCRGGCDWFIDWILFTIVFAATSEIRAKMTLGSQISLTFFSSISFTFEKN